jgi:hypothetical protein
MQKGIILVKPSKMTEILNRFSLLPEDMRMLILDDYVGLVQPKWVPRFEKSGRAVLKVNIAKGIFANIEKVLRQKQENPPENMIHCVYSNGKDSCYTAMTFTLYEDVYGKRTYSVMSYQSFYSDCTQNEKYCEIEFINVGTRGYCTNGSFYNAMYRYNESLKMVCEFPRHPKQYTITNFVKQNLFASYDITEKDIVEEEYESSSLMFYL